MACQTVGPPIEPKAVRARTARKRRLQRGGRGRIGTRFGYGRINRKEWSVARAMQQAQQPGSALEELSLRR